MSSNEDVALVGGSYFEFYDTSTGLWKRVPRIISTGDIGSTSEAKEKTTTEDRIKRYGAGIRDGADKNFKGQHIPVQSIGSEHYVDYLLQKEWLDKCKAETEMQMRLIWADAERAAFTFKPFGYMVDDSSAEDWKTFTVNGKQSSFVAWSTAPTLTAVTLNSTGTVSVGSGEQLTVTNDAVGAFWCVNEDTFTSDEPTVASVTKWGYVKGVSAGTATITVTRKVGDGTTVTNTVGITVS